MTQAEGVFVLFLEKKKTFFFSLVNEVCLYRSVISSNCSKDYWTFVMKEWIERNFDTHMRVFLEWDFENNWKRIFDDNRSIFSDDESISTRSFLPQKDSSSMLVERLGNPLKNEDLIGSNVYLNPSLKFDLSM